MKKKLLLNNQPKKNNHLLQLKANGYTTLQPRHVIGEEPEVVVSIIVPATQISLTLVVRA